MAAALIMKILIRADANSIIGTGHLSRMLALCETASKMGHLCCFVICVPSRDVKQKIQNAEHRIFEISSKGNSKKNGEETLSRIIFQEHDAQQTALAIKWFEPTWVIVDHYGLDFEWYQTINAYCENIMTVDDLANRSLGCDVILNQNLGISPTQYSGLLKENCEVLLGPRFALLRDEFSNWRDISVSRRINPIVKNVLITMGGSDYSNITLSVLKILSDSANSMHCRFTVVTGVSYIHGSNLKAFCEKSKLKIKLLSDIQNMAEVMAEADLCIGAGGSTSWERCCLGLPTIAISIANNQDAITDELHNNRLAVKANLNDLRVKFDRFFMEDGTLLLKKLTDGSKKICDGKGAFRVIKFMEDFNENSNT